MFNLVKIKAAKAKTLSVLKVLVLAVFSAEILYLLLIISLCKLELLSYVL